MPEMKIMTGRGASSHFWIVQIDKRHAKVAKLSGNGKAIRSRGLKTAAWTLMKSKRKVSLLFPPKSAAPTIILKVR